MPGRDVPGFLSPQGCVRLLPKSLEGQRGKVSRWYPRRGWYVRRAVNSYSTGISVRGANIGSALILYASSVHSST